MSESKSDALTTWLLFHVIVNTISLAFIYLPAEAGRYITQMHTKDKHSLLKPQLQSQKTEKKSASVQRGSKGKGRICTCIVNTLIRRY